MRAMILRMSLELLVDMCKPSPGKGWCLECNGLPSDATIHEVRNTYLANTLDIVVLSESWPDVPKGYTPPTMLAPMFRTIPQPGWSGPLSEL
jgi:hypothetical protein